MTNKRKIGCIIQARLGSNRFPKKILQLLDDKNTVLDYILSQLKHSNFLEEIILATTTQNHDNKIEEIANRKKLKSFRGSENDVLSRYYNCAKKFSLDIIIRITSDCPLIDPKILDKGIEIFCSNDYDILTTNQPYTFPDGLGFEIFSFSAIEKIVKKANLSSEREHVTPFFYNHPKDFKIFNYENKKNQSNIRCTIDYPEDLTLLRKLISRIKNRPILLNDIILEYEKDSKLIEINGNHKTLEGYKKSIIQDNITKKIGNDDD